MFQVILIRSRLYRSPFYGSVQRKKNALKTFHNFYSGSKPWLILIQYKQTNAYLQRTGFEWFCKCAIAAAALGGYVQEMTNSVRKYHIKLRNSKISYGRIETYSILIDVSARFHNCTAFAASDYFKSPPFIAHVQKWRFTVGNLNKKCRIKNVKTWKNCTVGRSEEWPLFHIHILFYTCKFTMSLFMPDIISPSSSRRVPYFATKPTYSRAKNLGCRPW